MKKLIISGVAVVLAVAAAPSYAGDAAAGKAKSAVCAGCHGQAGKSVAPNYPNLAGQNAPYLESALKQYKSGGRSDATMKAMAAPLTDADIANLAAYFSSL